MELAFCQIPTNDHFNWQHNMMFQVCGIKLIECLIAGEIEMKQDKKTKMRHARYRILTKKQHIVT